MADNYPARSNEYQVGGIKYNDYITSLNKVSCKVLNCKYLDYSYPSTPLQ